MQKPWQQQLLHKGALSTETCARVLMGLQQKKIAGNTLVPEDIEHAELSLYVMPSALVRVVLGQQNAYGVKAFFVLPEPDLVDEYKEFRGKPLSRISTKVLEYVVKAFSIPGWANASSMFSCGPMTALCCPWCGMLLPMRCC